MKKDFAIWRLYHNAWFDALRNRNKESRRMWVLGYDPINNKYCVVSRCGKNIPGFKFDFYKDLGVDCGEQIAKLRLLFNSDQLIDVDHMMSLHIEMDDYIYYDVNKLLLEYIIDRYPEIYNEYFEEIIAKKFSVWKETIMHDII